MQQQIEAVIFASEEAVTLQVIRQVTGAEMDSAALQEVVEGDQQRVPGEWSSFFHSQDCRRVPHAQQGGVRSGAPETSGTENSQEAFTIHS